MVYYSINPVNNNKKKNCTKIQYTFRRKTEKREKSDRDHFQRQRCMH